MTTAARAQSSPTLLIAAILAPLVAAILAGCAHTAPATVPVEPVEVSAVELWNIVARISSDAATPKTFTGRVTLRRFGQSAGTGKRAAKMSFTLATGQSPDKWRLDFFDLFGGLAASTALDGEILEYLDAKTGKRGFILLDAQSDIEAGGFTLNPVELERLIALDITRDAESFTGAVEKSMLATRRMPDTGLNFLEITGKNRAVYRLHLAPAGKTAAGWRIVRVEKLPAGNHATLLAEFEYALQEQDESREIYPTRVVIRSELRGAETEIEFESVETVATPIDPATLKLPSSGK